MKLSQKAINDFKKCWFNEFKEEISDEKAQEEGVKLLRLFKKVYKPISEKEVENYFKTMTD